MTSSMKNIFKEPWYQFRFLIAEKLMFWMLGIMPDSAAKVTMAGFIHEYLKLYSLKPDNIHAD